jgi:hypothetical protein
MIYYNKYIKYKTKYNNLKIQTGGYYTIDITREMLLLEYNTKSAIEIREDFIDRIIDNSIKIKENEYLFSIKINDILYDCILIVKNTIDAKFDLKLLNKDHTIVKYDPFIEIFSLYENDITTKSNFLTFPEKSKLDTIMIILKEIYKYFKIETIILTDLAKFSCPKIETDRNNYQYNAIFYRIFKTTKPFNEISIYKKYDYKYDCDEDKTINLEFIRNADIDELINNCEHIISKIEPRSYYIEILEKLKTHRSIMVGDITISNFFNKINFDNYIECIENYEYINLLFYCYELYHENKQSTDNIYNNLPLFNNLIEIITCVDELKYSL